MEVFYEGRNEMNKVILIGRLTKDPTVTYSTDGKGVARYNVAVDRYKNNETDFISCVAFGKNAEFAEKYLKKGTKILIEGRILTGDYTNKEGRKIYTTDVVADRHEFVEKKTNELDVKPEISDEEFMKIPDGIEAELPFM